MITVLDCNNFWSPSGGGVRRYHLEKIEYFKYQEHIKYVFVMHDSKTYSEQIGPNAFIEHIKVPKVLGNWEYRYLFKRGPLEPIILKHRPDLIEVGSPYIMPSIVHSIVKRNHLKTKVFGFWHADFPVTYVGRSLKNSFLNLQKIGENLAWRFARKNYNRMDGVLVASKTIMDRMDMNGIKNLYYSPLGVDHLLFHPDKRDQNLVQSLQDENPNRLILFFSHRFSKEKGLHILIEAYDIVVKKIEIEPAIVFVGTGPYEHLVKKAVVKHRHAHFKGFIKDKEEMARYYASADLGFALSEWETFGLSLLEALSCGLPLISAGKGAAPEHIEKSGVGITLAEITPLTLAEAIIDFSKKKKKDWNTQTRQYAESLSWKKCFDRQLSIYKNAILD
ncbi:glycosyltransferase [Ekhidna sp.]